MRLESVHSLNSSFATFSAFQLFNHCTIIKVIGTDSPDLMNFCKKVIRKFYSNFFSIKRVFRFLRFLNVYEGRDSKQFFSLYNFNFWDMFAISNLKSKNTRIILLKFSSEKILIVKKKNLIWLELFIKKKRKILKVNIKYWKNWRTLSLYPLLFIIFHFLSYIYIKNI